MLKEAIAGILISAAKIVFLLMALTVCVAYITGKMTTEQFVPLAMLSFSFYFGTPNKPVIDDSGAAGMK